MVERMGLRERKARQTRQRIGEVATRLFVERGFEAVTVAEIAEAAEVARVTLFKYFPTKESLVLDLASDDDPARIVAGRRPGESALDALRAHYRAFAAEPGIDAPEELIARMRVITNSPTLTAGLQRFADQQREALARTLAAEAGTPDHATTGSDPHDGDEITAYVVAAQVSGMILALKATFFRHLVGGWPLDQALARLRTDVEHAFDLLEHGIGDRYRR